MKPTATMTKLTEVFDQAIYDRYVAREVRGMKRLRTRGHVDFRDWSDAMIDEAATTLARINRAGYVYR